MEFLFILLILFLILVLCTILGRKRFKGNGYMKRNAKKAKAFGCTELTHVSGLTVSDGAKCGLIFLRDEIVVLNGRSDYHIRTEQITEVTTKTETEINKAYVSSTGGALAGGLMFGAVGAAIGGRTKQKPALMQEAFLS